MPTISTVSAGSIAAYGTIRIADKNVTTITDVEIIHDYSGSTPAPVDGRLYVARVVGGNRQNHNTYDYLIFYYNAALTQPVTNLIFKIKGDRYFHAAANGYITELLPSLGWDNYRYTANWAGVNIDNPAWLGEVSNNPDWSGVKIINSSWQGVLTNTENWIGVLIPNNSWIAPLINNPNWTAQLIDNPNWLGELVNNPNWTAQLIDNPNWVQTYSDNPNWTAQLIDNPDWIPTTHPTPNWEGVPIYDQDNNLIGYDTSNPSIDNGGLLYDERTEGNGGKIYETRSLSNGGLLPDERTEGNNGKIYETRSEDNGGLIRDLNGNRTEGNGGKIYETRSESNGGLIPEPASEDNGGLIRDTSNPQLSNGGQYYNPLAPRTTANGGFEVSYDSQYRSKENGGLLYDLTATRTLANNGIIHSIDGVYRTVENGGLVYLAERTIENGAFVSIWVPWVITNPDYGISVIFTRSHELLGNKAYNSKLISYYLYNLSFSSSITSNLQAGPDGYIYKNVTLEDYLNFFSFETYYSIISYKLSSLDLNKPTVGDTLLNGNTPYKKTSQSPGVVFFAGTKLDPLSVHGSVLNAVGGSYEKYTTNALGVIDATTRFDGEHWYSFDTSYADTIKNGGSYTIELFVKPDMGNASLVGFAPPYNSPEIAREAEMGIISISDGINSNTKWILSIAHNPNSNQNYFKFNRKTPDSNELIIMPATYTEGDTWQYIAITYTSETNILSFYLNGSLICKTIQSSPATFTTSATLDVGVRENMGSAKSGVFNGRIKDLRIINRNIYQAAEATGQITVPTLPLQYYGYGSSSSWNGGNDVLQSSIGEYENVKLLTFRLEGFMSYFTGTPPVLEGTAYTNRPSINNVKIVGLYPEKVLIEYELSSYKLITKTNIAIQKNAPEALPIEDPYFDSYIEETYELLDATTIYPGNSENVIVLEELTVAPEKLYHFSIIAASSAGTAQSNIYSFKTPSL